MKKFSFGLGVHQRFQIGAVLNLNIDVTMLNVKNATSFLTIPTYIVGNTAVVHPSVLYFKNGWNNYKYWMAFTPYYQTNAIYENPSILCSNDGVTWIVPDGLTNPIQAKPATYNADPCLFMDKNGLTMYCIWRERDAAFSLKLKSSTDGVTWGNLTTILTGGTADRSVPTVFYENNKYTLISANLDATPNILNKYESNTPLSGWTYVGNIGLPTIPGVDEIWHMEIRKYYNTYVMIFSTALSRLYLATSLDLVTWNVSSLIGRKDNIHSGFYKSTMILSDDRKSLKLWYGTDVWRFGFTTIEFISNPFFQAHRDGIANASVGGGDLVWDSFTRVNTTSGLGTSTSGHAWTVSGVMGIADNQAYAVSGVNNRATITCGKSDFVYKVQITTYTKALSWIIFRLVDADNFWRFGELGSGAVVLQKVSGGVTLVDTHGDLISGDVVTVKCNGNSIKIWVNENLVTDITDATHNTGTRVGFQSSSNLIRFDNLIVSDIP